MKSPARSRRHKTVEPIDFRELLDAPALNGLKEALAHRRESEADVTHFLSPPTAIPVADNEPDAVESTAVEFDALTLTSVDTPVASPRKFGRPGQIGEPQASESHAVESDASEMTAFQLTADTVPARELDAIKPRPVNSTAFDSDAPNLEALDSHATPCQRDTRGSFNPSASEITALQSHAVKTTAVQVAALEPNAIDLESDLLDERALGRRTGRRTFNVQPATRIETIFSPSEMKVLNWMWSRGRAVDRVSMARLVTASNGEGMRRLAVHFGVAYTTFRNLVRSLSTKLAVEIVKQETTHPAIYLVYHYSAILERLRQAGLIGIIHKGSNAWVLVDADSQPAPAQPELTLQELKRKLIGFKRAAVQSTAPILAEAKPNAADTNALNSLKYQHGAVESRAHLNDSSAVNLVAPIRSKEYPSRSEFPSSTMLKSNAPKPVIDALFDRTQRTDADAARSITSSCTAVNPTVTHDEIARMIREFHIPPSISNPVGLLIRTLATRCEPESLERYRRHWKAEDLQAARFKAQQQQENERIARMVLEDPETTESELEWARGVLGRSSF